MKRAWYVLAAVWDGVRGGVDLLVDWIGEFGLFAAIVASYGLLLVAVFGGR